MGVPDMENILIIAQYASALTGICATILLFVKPIRDRVIGTLKLREGLKCLLRSQMLHVYYKHHDTGSMRQYEYENFLFLYRAYKELGGNSFIDKIYDEVRAWEVVS